MVSQPTLAMAHKRDFCKKSTLPEECSISHLNLGGRLHNCLLNLTSTCKSPALFHRWINNPYMQMIHTRVWPALPSTVCQHAGETSPESSLLPSLTWLANLSVTLVMWVYVTSASAEKMFLQNGLSLYTKVWTKVSDRRSVLAIKCGALMELSGLCSICVFLAQLPPLTSAVVCYWRSPNHQLTASAIQRQTQVFVCI